MAILIVGSCTVYDAYCIYYALVFLRNCFEGALGVYEIIICTKMEHVNIIMLNELQRKHDV